MQDMPKKLRRRVFSPKLSLPAEIHVRRIENVLVDAAPVKKTCTTSG
jgi:hypothetical protein